MKVKSESEVVQSCPTPSDPIDCSLPGSSVHGIFQAGVLEWGAIAFSDLLTLKVCNLKNFSFNLGYAVLLADPSQVIWRTQWHPTPVLLPGKSHGQRSLVGCGPWGREESDTAE